ncbi:Mini-ribonuclease 3 [Paenibacillus eucommiae]|uniref:Mini-ribonuclease 3 n=1 Tax=Paenibacillus eucommiae TaxID=1355755 RepID=A0ABS4J9C3_9BACL|nr:Mini-ribonuclease 3 [Paenibacillus eucommiae]MBP1996448.1 ribonuclease-3 family protein [Paenibacillus eucommiae]
MSEWADELNLFHFPPSKAPHLLNPLVLAYIGDAIFEVYIRQYVISQTNHRPNHLHQTATKYVSAKAQAKLLETLMPLLTQEEKDVVKRGRNAKSGSTAKNAEVLEYRHSTAFECLVGYLYYTQSYARLKELLDFVMASKADAGK